MTTESYSNNISLLKNRWPDLAKAIDEHDINHVEFELVERQCATLSVNGIQLSSAYDPVEEALAYRSITSGDTYHIWGFGLGSVPEVLLNDRQLKKINLYIYNLDVIKLVLTLVDKPWLADDRIELIYVYKDMPNLPKILEKIFHHGSCLLNADLQLLKYCKADLKWLEHRLEHKVISEQVNVHQLQQTETFEEIEKENYPLLKQLHPVDLLIENSVIKQAICIGAGPSLDAHIEEVKALYKSANKPLFIAPSTALKALLKHNITPDIVTILDKNSSAELDYDRLKKAVLVGGSHIPKAIFEQWQGRKYYFNANTETYNDINKRLPTKRLFVFGSVIHPIIHLAIAMGAKTIRFIGTDFGFPNDILHASSENIREIDTSLEIENGYGEYLKSSPTYRMFCSGVENMIAAAPHVDFINMSRMGAKIIGTRYEDEER